MNTMLWLWAVCGASGMMLTGLAAHLAKKSLTFPPVEGLYSDKPIENLRCRPMGRERDAT